VQAPATHVWLAVQSCPHVPQFERSFWRFAHQLVLPDPQVVSPASQACLQVPFEHTAPKGQVFPHSPQLLKLLFRFAQNQLQSVKGGVQVGPQTPPLHTGVDPEQVVPHVPQFAGSSSPMVQNAPGPDPHCMKLPWQTQEPAWQTVYGELQTLSHPPQFLGSTWVLVHTVPQAVPVVPVHEVAQTPFVQTWPAPHVVPHVPQLRGSVLRSVQAWPHLSGARPTQTVSHWAEAQNWPAGQTWPQLPQFEPSRMRSTHRPEQVASYG